MVEFKRYSERFFKAFDSYGKPIGLTLNNTDVHKTVLGGIITLLIFVLCIIYAGIIIANPLQANLGSSTGIGDEYEIVGNNETKVTTKSMNFYNSSTDYDLIDGNFMFAANLGKNGWDIDQMGIYFDVWTWDGFEHSVT